MKNRAAVLTVVAILVILAAVYRWRPASAPTGQGPLVTLSSANLSVFTNAFDAGADASRLVLLLSPT